MKRVSVKSFLPLLFAGFLALGSCVSSGESGGASRPQWMDSYPASELHYTGIAGVPWSGNESEDRSAALASARAEIAAAISVSVEQDIEIIQEETGTASNSSITREVRERVRQSVQASLQNVQIVDTFYDKASGYWVYARLSKADWEAIRQQEIRQLHDRVMGILEPLFTDSSVPFATVLRQLARARQILEDSPWSWLTLGTVANRSGILVDLVDQEVIRLLDATLLQVTAQAAKINLGDALDMTVAVEPLLSHSVGTLPLLISGERGVAARTLTDQSGLAEIRIEAGQLPVGNQSFLVSPDLEALGFPVSLAGTYPVPAAQLVLEIEAPELFLLLNTPESLSGMNLGTAVEAVFSEKDLPLVFRRGGQPGGRLILEVDLQIQDYPKYLENAPDMASAMMRFTLIKDGQRIFSHETTSAKEGGLTPLQAHQRATAALLRDIREEQELFSGMVNALMSR
jgi:hypothetical protein